MGLNALYYNLGFSSLRKLGHEIRDQLSCYLRLLSYWHVTAPLQFHVTRAGNVFRNALAELRRNPIVAIAARHQRGAFEECQTFNKRWLAVAPIQHRLTECD